MKNLKLRTVKLALFSTVISLAAFVSACNPINSEKEAEKHQSTDSFAEGNVKEASITFRSGKVIEIAYISVEGGKEAQLRNEYFPKILLIGAKYEGKMLGSFQVTAVTGGEIQPQMIAIFEWPNLAARDKFLADKDAKKLFPIRDDAMTFFKQAYFSVDEDVAVTFREDKIYEFFNAWLTPEAKIALPEYFKRSEEVKKKYGPPAFLASLKPLKNASKEDYVLQPHRAAIVEWNNTNTYFGLIADPEFKKVVPLLEKSLTRIDMLHAKFNFPQ